MTGPFDPARLFVHHTDCYPPLGSGAVARLMLETDRMMVYSLGDATAHFSFCHVVILLYGFNDYAVRFYRSTIDGDAVRVTNMNDAAEQHFHLGKRARDKELEEAYTEVLHTLQRRYGGNLLRAYQLDALPSPRGDCPTLLPLLIWRDVMRVLLERMRRLMRSPAPEDLLDLARHLEQQYGYDTSSTCCIAALGRWWWRYRLAARLQWHFPALPVHSLRLLADDLRYIVQYPYTNVRV